LAARFPYFCLVGLFLAGCGGTATGPSPAAPVRVTVQPTPTFAGSPDTATFTIRVENVSPTPTQLTFPSACRVLPYFVDGRTGQPVVPRGGGFACATVMVYQPLRPGESFSEVITVKAGDGPAPQQIVLPAGDYRLYAKLEDSVHRLQSEPLAFSLR
jgi:hypothetical protein